MLDLSSCKWGTFMLGEEFDINATNSSIDKKNLINTIGDIPYITRTEKNNGVAMLVGMQPNYPMDEGDVITIGLDTQTVFYQPTPFYTGQNIQVVRHPQLNRFNASFLIIPLRKQLEKLNWGGNGATLTRLKRSKILLPTTSLGEIDWAFMEAYMKQVENDSLKPILNKLKERIANVSKPKDASNWNKFDFIDIFEIEKGFYNKKPPFHKNGTYPFIGATNSNNGFTGFTTYESIRDNSKTGHGKNEPIEKKIFPKNAICVTNNGSVGYAYFQSHEFTCTHDVNPLYLKDRELNRYIATFLIGCIEKQRVCFEYARKWRPKRMVKSKLLLPITSDGTPDWQYMEDYMRYVEQCQLSSVIEVFSKRVNNSTSQIL